MLKSAARHATVNSSSSMCQIKKRCRAESGYRTHSRKRSFAHGSAMELFVPVSLSRAPCVRGNYSVGGSSSSRCYSNSTSQGAYAAALVCAALASRRNGRCLRAVATRQPMERGEVLPAQPVPEGIPAPPYVSDPDKVRGWWNSQIARKSDEDVEAMRRAGKLAHSALDLAEQLIQPGITTEEMDKELHAFICDHGAYPSDLQYKGFPKSVMISINEAPCLHRSSARCSGEASHTTGKSSVRVM